MCISRYKARQALDLVFSQCLEHIPYPAYREATIWGIVQYTLHFVHSYNINIFRCKLSIRIVSSFSRFILDVARWKQQVAFTAVIPSSSKTWNSGALIFNHVRVWVTTELETLPFQCLIHMSSMPAQSRTKDKNSN